jgi:hypothetical protein
VGQGDWINQGNVPYSVGSASLTMPSGALVGWLTPRVDVDPDGIAATAKPFTTGIPPQGGRPFATASNTLVAVSGDGHHITASTWSEGGTWSDPMVVYTDPDRWMIVQLQFPAADMTPDGQVTVLFRSRPAGSGPHHPLDLEAIRFDAPHDPVETALRHGSGRASIALSCLSGSPHR